MLKILQNSSRLFLRFALRGLKYSNTMKTVLGIFGACNETKRFIVEEKTSTYLKCLMMLKRRKVATQEMTCS